MVLSVRVFMSPSRQFLGEDKNRNIILFLRLLEETGALIYGGVLVLWASAGQWTGR